MWYQAIVLAECQCGACTRKCTRVLPECVAPECHCGASKPANLGSSSLFLAGKLFPPDALFTLLFHTFHYHGGTILYFYPSFQLLGVGWVAGGVPPGGTRRRRREQRWKFFDSNSLLPSARAVASLHFSSWSRCKEKSVSMMHKSLK